MEHPIKQPLKASVESTVPHLLVVDDDLDLCEVLESYLRAEDFAVSFAHSGVEGTKAGIDGAFELIILDVMLPDKKGFDVLRDIRRRARTPVLMLTAKGDEFDRMKRNGSIVFAFRSVQMPDGTTRDIHSTVGGIQAERSEGLDVGKEGEIKATTSTVARLIAPVSLVGPSRAVADTTLQKTAWSRSGEGRKGFGLLGAGAAQASAGTAIGFGYFGAAKRLCDAFITKGSNVELPVNTPIFLRLDPYNPSVALATR